MIINFEFLMRRSLCFGKGGSVEHLSGFPLKIKNYALKIPKGVNFPG